ncbi:hypothetical protein ACA910_000499 [Epithemia clementina (nom. ined.)]
MIIIMLACWKNWSITATTALRQPNVKRFTCCCSRRRRIKRNPAWYDYQGQSIRPLSSDTSTNDQSTIPTTTTITNSHHHHRLSAPRSLSSLDGKVAIVTGSTQGLGEAVARLFRERGVSGLVICGRNEERGRAVTRDLNTTTNNNHNANSACRAVFVPGDLAQVDVCRRIVATAKETFGRVDILVNAAAVTDRGGIADTTPELWDWMMNINVRAPFLLMQESIQLMKEQEPLSILSPQQQQQQQQQAEHSSVMKPSIGTIVNIGSVAAYGCVPTLLPYAISKGALVTMTKNMAYATMRDRIRINTLNIGWMDTPGEHVIQTRYENAPPDWLAQAEAQQPFGRLLKPAEVARAVAFLASEESGLMTGSIVDYGQFVHGAGAMEPPPP